VVDLRRGFDHLWSRRFSSDTRNKIRKAEKRGVEVQWAPTSQLLAVHWDLFMRWTAQQARERGIPKPLAVALGRRRESLARYEAIARGLGDSCQVALARVDGQPAASAIVLFGRVHAHYWRATSDRALVDRRYANHLLLARIIEYAAANGCRYLQMGESGGKRSLVEFKERFAATPVSYDELRFAPLGVTLATRGRDLVIRAAMSGGVKAAVWWKRRGTLRH
jgi:lipid II:glycine glycyltransferase (peptidoglycan interpeptide bridge formation enzyme)